MTFVHLTESKDDTPMPELNWLGDRKARHAARHVAHRLLERQIGNGDSGFFDDIGSKVGVEKVIGNIGDCQLDLDDVSFF